MQFPRDSPSTCISTMFVNLRSMHEHTSTRVNVLYQMSTTMQGHKCMQCVCVCTYALQEEEESRYLSIQVSIFPLEDEICMKSRFSLL